MSEAGGFADLNLDRMQQRAGSELAKVQNLRERLGTMVGRAEAADGRVKVEYAPTGLSMLEIDPRAMRMASTDLADAIKTAVRKAEADLARLTDAAMNDEFGEQENPLNILRNRQNGQRRLDEAQQEFDRKMDKTLSDLDRIERGDL